ncbi:MAG: adenylate/guanylate cyclase domain-containing protein [Betaproteobacteria bacterium]|nr:adenylate/guanylate cyclase domain-containing protein [Betaproteobacteria bacterium]
MLLAARFYEVPIVTTLESITYDTRLRLTMPSTQDSRIVIVDIDEKSLAEEGRWPWRRDRVAALVDKLFDRYAVAVIGFDVVFPEKDESSGLQVLRELSQSEFKDVPQFQNLLETVAPRLEFDRVLADHLRNRPVVLGYYFSNQKQDGRGLALGSIPAPVLPAGTFTGRNIDFSSFEGYGGNLPELQQAAASGGHFTPATDHDGVHRRVPILAQYKGAYYEPLALAIVRLLLKSPKVVPGYPSDSLMNRSYPGLEWVEAAPVRIPVDEQANALVPYRGPQGSFVYVSATDVLRDRTAVEQLKDKIVLVGTTAPGLQDLRSTPVAPLFPGVEIHANLIAGMLDGTIKQRPPYVLGAEVVLLGLAGLSLAFALPFLSPIRSTVATVVTLAGIAAVNVAIWHYGNLVLPLASGLLMVFLLYAVNMSYGYFVESRSKQRIAGLFGQYVPPELVDEMSRNPDEFSMESESREMTVLFSDVRGFTTISEGLEPKALSQLMNDYLTPMTRVIHRQRGTIDKYMGDAIMAFWGAPVEDAEHARHAVLAGLEMERTLEEMAAEFKAKGWPPLRIGIGVNTGKMSVGNMGSEIRVAYTVMSDSVNLASRLEGLTKRYGVTMLVGEDTRAAVPDVVFRELDRVRVKGKDEPVTIYEPVGMQGEVPKEKLDRMKLFHQALKFYRAQDWDKAELQLLNLQRADAKDGLYSAFLDRVAYLRSHPPGPAWDGVFDFDTK